jgi:hypothetical protein
MAASEKLPSLARTAAVGRTRRQPASRKGGERDRPRFCSEVDGAKLSKMEFLDAADNARLEGDSARADLLLGLPVSLDQEISEARQSAYLTSVYAASLPPLFLLALGVLIGWAARGSRSDPR